MSDKSYRTQPWALSLPANQHLHTVYAHRDADGTVIYVGCTNNLSTRTATHRRSSPWRDDIATVDVVAKGLHRYDALDLERSLIEELRPAHNYYGTPEWAAATGARLAAARRAAAKARAV